MADFPAILDAAVSHGMELGIFDQVNQHEPKSAPGNGLNAAMWIDRIEPIRSSGLASTSGRLVLMVRVYLPMLSDPQDGIDAQVLNGAHLLMAAYSGDFDLNSTVRNVDLLGAYGVPMSAQAGYLNQDNKLFRVMVVTVPLIVNDIWDQVA